MIDSQNQDGQKNTEKQLPVTAIEIAIALISYLIGYIYIKFKPLTLVLVMVLIIGCTEFLNHKRKLTKENIFYTVCFIMITIAYAFSNADKFGYLKNQIWDEDQLFLFTHGMAIWYVLCRSGKLVDGKSSVFFPMDILNGAFIIPIGNLFLRLKTVLILVARYFNSRKKERTRNYWYILAIIISVFLFITAAGLLAQSDDTFDKVVGNVLQFFRFDWDTLSAIEILFSIPVGAYLFGLMDGCYRYREEKLPKIKEEINDSLISLKRIPAWFWLIVVSLFSVMYVFYFVLQGSYLFGAFTNTLPEGFIVSQYAVQGFWQLCKVMAVNGVVLYVVTRMADDESKNNPYFKFACVLLLVESVMFAVVALSKIILYISIFGFTPKRIQGLWLVAVLLVGCMLWTVSLLKEKKTFAYWMYFTILSLTITCYYGLIR